ncbi:response regulator [Roseivirga sp. UBA838]|uniref:response regulator n=1 Tax=Roseivirga sp. UBA838 TaxID=1947393 RepID=UPI00257BFD1F|nr:response regulator [Roseivirga sp. UBA838]
MGQNQGYRFSQRSIGVEEGLSSRNTNSFFMDSQGIMWMTGGLGLDRYDGHRFEHYDVNSGQLQSNSFVSISEGPDGKIWLGELGETYNIQLFDPILKKSSWWWEEIDTTALKGEPVQLVIGDMAEPAIWLVTAHRVLRYGQSKLLEEVHFSTIPIRESMPATEGLWIYTGENLKLIGAKGRVKRDFNLPPNELFILEGVDSQSNIYYRQKVSFDDLDRSRKFRNNKPWNLGGNRPWNRYVFLSINPYKDHILTSDHVTGDMVVFNTDLKEIARFVPDPHFYKFPPQYYWDRLGNGWTQFNELVHVFALEKYRFKNHLTNIITYGELGVGARGIHIENDTTIFVSSLGGSFILNPKTGNYRRFLSKPGKLDIADLLGLRQLSILKNSEGKILFSNEGGRINYFEPRTNAYGTIFPQIDSAQQDKLYMNWVMHEHSSGDLWIGQNAGLSKVEKGAGTYLPFNDYNNFIELKTSAVYDIHQTNDTTLWIASEKGLYRLHPAKGIVEKARLQSVHSGDLAVLDINSFDDTGLLYLATQSGLMRYHTTQKTVDAKWNTSNGLSDNICYAVYKDSLNRLWAPTNKGINLINPDGSVQIFQTGDGLIHNEFNRTSHAQAPDGRLFFGSLNGVTEVNPSDFPLHESTHSGVLLTNLRIQKASDGSYESYQRDLSSLDEIVLHPSDLGLELQFSLLDYLGNQFRSFSYKIEGLDNDWTFVDKPEVRINRLPYGNYQLLLRGQAPNGVFTSQKAFKLRVLKPIYLQWWFFLLLIGLVVVCVLILQRIREKKLLQRQKELETKINEATQEIRKQAEELKSLDQLKSNFFANISHELKTPLSLVLAPLEKTLKNNELEQDLKKDLALARRNAESVKTLVNEILDLTRLENGVAQPRYSRVDIEAFLKVLVENFQPKAQANGIELSFESQINNEPTWVVDRNMTEKILNNILSNALRHTPRQGQVELIAYHKSGDLVLEVKDSGTGISQEDLPYIFDRFFQTKDPNKKAEGGTGIGLALSNELAQAMNGDLSVESEPGVGSTFTLTLPKASIAASIPTNTAPVSEPTDHPYLPHIRYTVLLVDDNEDIRSFVSSNLQDQFEVIAANNGHEALSLLQKETHEIHLIISDMMMPEMDGLELLERLKAEDKTKNIPVIFLTARTAERDKIEAFRIGVDDYLTKPFSLDELRARIKNQLKAAYQKKMAEKGEEEIQDLQLDLSDNDVWLRQLRQLTEQHINTVNFSIGMLAEKMGMSERTLFRRIKKLTGYSPNVYLKEIRLQMARRMLEEGKCKSIASVAQEIGFTSFKYFSKLFKERFGKLPSEYL